MKAQIAIHVVGAGVVGSATGQVVENLGYKVTYVDVDPSRIRALLEGGRDASTELNLGVDPLTVVFICVPTPATSDGYDLSPLRRALSAVGEAIRRQKEGFTIVAVRSTVPPLTWSRVITPELESATGRRIGDGYSFAFVPEFLRQEFALQDAESPRVTVIGAAQPMVAEQLAQLFAPLGGTIRTFDDPTTVELIKLANNCYNAAKISFWNEVWGLCSALDVDQVEVATVVAESAEASYNPLYGTRGGYPFGGACLPKDLNGLLGFAASEMLHLPLHEAVREVNMLAAHPEIRSVSQQVEATG